MPSASTVAELAVVIRADTSAAEKSLSTFGESIKQGVGVGVGLGAIEKGIELVGSAFSVAKGSIIDLNSSLEQSKIAFTTMLGSAEKADTFLKQLQLFAAATPFEFPDLVDASKRMLAFGFESKNVVPLLTAVGNAVAAVGGGKETIDGVTTALGQMQAKGKVSAEEMGQLAERGIPAWDMLAKHMGVSVAEAMDAVSKGQVKAGTFVEAFQAGSAERFGGMMEKQSLTFAGAMSTIKDSLSMATATAFQPFFALLSEGAVAVSAFLQSEAFTAWAGDVATAIKGVVVVLTDFARYMLAVLDDGDTMNDWLSHLPDSFQGVAFAIGTVTAALVELAPYAKALAVFMWDNRDAILAVGLALATFAILTTVIGWVTAIAGAIGAVTAAISASGGILAALGALVAILGGPVTLIIAAVALAVGALAYAWANNWGDIQGKTAAVVEFLSGIPALVEGFFTDIGHAAVGLQMAVEQAWGAIKTTTETIWNGITTFLTDWWRVILVVLTGPVGAVAVLVIDNWETIRKGTETAFGLIGTVLTTAWTAITTGIGNAFTATGTGIIAVVSSGWDTVKTGIDTVFGTGTGDTITGIVATGWATVASVTQSLIAGDTASALAYAQAGWGLIKTGIDTLFGAGTAASAETILGIVTAGWTAVAGVTNSLIAGDTASALAYAKAGWALVKTGIDTIFGSGTGDTISGAVAVGWAAVVTLTSTLLSGAGAESLKSVVAAAWDGIVGQLKALAQAGSDLLAAAKSVGVGIVTSIQDGIKDTLGSFWSWLQTNFVDKIPSYVKELLGIHSPSSVMFDIGVSLVEGLKRGMESKLPSIDELVERVIGKTGAMSGDVDAWLKAALAYTHAPESWLEPLKWIVSHESGGDPKAKNPDSTASGLFQIIDSTWAASRDKSLPNEIFNPIINAIGGIRYIRGRYGDPFEAVDFWKKNNHYGVGGWAGLHGPELAWLGERGPEYVVSNAALRGGAGGGDTYIIDARGAQVYDGSKFEDLLVGALERAGRRGRIARMTVGPGRG